MDMSHEGAAAVKQAAPQAVIVYDKFHVSKHLNEAVDKVRKEEHRRLLEQATRASPAPSTCGCKVPARTEIER